MGQYVSKKRTPSRGIPPGTAGDLLLHALEDLTQIDFKKFQDALAHGDLQGRRCIPRGRLEKADWMDTKNLMLDFYGGEAALDVAIAVFERIHLRNAADLLRESRERGGRAERLPGQCSVPRGPGTLSWGSGLQEPVFGARGTLLKGRWVGVPVARCGGLLQGGGGGRGFGGVGGSAALPTDTPFSCSPGARCSAGFIVTR